MRGDILGIERRRRWSDQDKLLIVSSIGVDGATVTQVGQRNDVTRQQIYAWRHELKKKGLWSPEEGAIFLPIGVPATECAPAAPVPAASVSAELRLAKGRTLRFDSVMSEVTLMRPIRAVDGGMIGPGEIGHPKDVRRRRLEVAVHLVFGARQGRIAIRCLLALSAD